MSAARRVLALARGDFLERARRYSFLVTLGAAAYLAYTVHAGWWVVRVRDLAPAAGPVRLGMLIAVATGTLLSLVGFYVVRGSVDRDRRTGVGPILAATPVTRPEYAAAKFVSNLAVFAAMLLVLALLALAMAAVRWGIGAGDVWAVAGPTALLAGPALALVAGLAVLFDSVPWLRGTAGNVLYFFLWVALLSAVLDGSPALDVTGFALVRDSMHLALAEARPDAAATGLTVQFRPGGLPETTSFDWAGVSWSPAAVAWRLYWVAGGLALAGVSALGLRLFDPFGDAVAAGDARGPEDEGDGRTAGAGRPPNASKTTSIGTGREPAPAAGLSPSDLAPPESAGRLRAFVRAAGAELRLLVSGHAWWWYGGILAANAAALFAPADMAAGTLLVAWLLPISAWSSLGCRERERGTEQMLLSAPGPRRRQLPAQLAAGVVLAVAAAAGPVARLAAAGDGASLVAVGGGAVFVPALALCSGAWSGRPRLFEALYVVLWYLGPLNRAEPIDFMGVTGRALEHGAPARFLAAAVALAGLAWVGRGRRLDRVG